MQRSNKRGKQGVGAQHDIGNKADVRSEIELLAQICHICLSSCIKALPRRYKAYLSPKSTTMALLNATKVP